MKRKKKEPIDFKYNFKLYLKFLKPHVLIFLAIIVATLFYEISTFGINFLFKRVIDEGTLFVSGLSDHRAFTATLFSIALAYITLVIIKSGSKWLNLDWLNTLESRLIADLKRYFYNHILALSYRFHTNHKTGALIARLLRGASGIERLTDFLTFNLVSITIQLLAAGVSIAYFDWKSSLILMVVSALFVAYSVFIQQKQKPATDKANQTEDSEKAMIADTFSNIDSIKYFGKEKFVGTRYKALSEETKRTLLINWNYYRSLDSGQIAILYFGTLAVLYFPFQEFLGGTLTLGTVAFIYTTYGLMLTGLVEFTRGIRSFYQSMADLNDLFKYNKISNDIVDAPDAGLLSVVKGDIDVRDVSFKYHERAFFKNFSLSIPANKRVAIVGPSGSGKSTLIKLLYRLYNVDKGSIFIDGIDTRTVTQESLRSELSIVPQECVLFDDTIYNNIKFSRPQATRAEVTRAIRLAQLSEFVARLPEKENTIVGERGVKLSGGEKQRVSIARAILADKKILVLDEATSSLDSETEHEIQKGLENLMKGRTSLIIAHRLSTIMHADIIVVLDKGKIVQQGTHRELIAKPGMYKRLWELQRGGYLRDDAD